MAWKISRERQAFLRSPEGQKFQADIKDWRKRNELRKSLGNSAPPVKLPTSAMLRRPGELESVLEGIRIRLHLADQRHRENIDREVTLCMRTAGIISSAKSAMREVLGGEWAKHWRESDKAPSEALRFVFSKVYSCPKKASFYYRATRVFYEEGIKLEDLPKFITEGGGYRALAKANVRFPRPKKTTEVDNDATSTNGEQNQNEETEAFPDEESAHQDVDGEDEPTAPLRLKGGPQQDAASGGDGEPQTVLIADFEGEGHEFLGLPVGCYASVCLQVTANEAGRRAIKIYSAIADE